MATYGLRGSADRVPFAGLPPPSESQPDVSVNYAYAEGEGIKGGECGKWLTFLVRKTGGASQGIVRLYLDYADDAAFRSSVFINHLIDERDLLRDGPSCFNNRLANNGISDSIEHSFVWDVCVLSKGAYNVRYRVNKPGAYRLHVKLDGGKIPGSPFAIFISDGVPCTAATRIYGRNIERCMAIPYVPRIAEALISQTSDRSSYGPPGSGKKSEEKRDLLPKVSFEKNCKLRTDVTPCGDGANEDLGRCRRDRGISESTNLRRSHEDNSSNSDSTIQQLLKLWSCEESFDESRAAGSGPRGSNPREGSSPKDAGAASNTGLRQRALLYLEKLSLINQVEIHLADANGNAVTVPTPCLRAWGENYSRVISQEYRGKGVFLIRYVVMVPREGVRLIKERQSKDSALPSSMKVASVPCKLNIEIDGKPVFGAPLHPFVENITYIENFYQVMKTPAEGVLKQFEELLERRDFDACLELYNNSENRDTKEKLAAILLGRLTKLEANNIATAKEIRLVNSLKLQSLGKILELVQNQYQKMLQYKTDNIVNSIRELKTFQEESKDQEAEGKNSGQRKQFNNLGDVILNYRLIGDELRKLHRYDLAEKFDKVNDRMCDEIDIGMWTSIIKQKETKVNKLRKDVQEACKQLDEFSSRMKTKYDKPGRTNLDDFKHKPGFAFNQAVQTNEPEGLSSKMEPLLLNRCSNVNKSSDVDLLVQSHWRKCNNYDIQATITKVLKSAPRLKNSLSELFAYYGTSHLKDKDRPLVGLTRASMELFVIEARLNKYLIANEHKLQWLFEKFSRGIVLSRGDGSLAGDKIRVIPEHFWCAFLREIAYLNLLYTIAESGDKDLLRDTRHPSRLVAFYHFCNEHLTPLYGLLFNTKPEFQKCLKFPDTNASTGFKSVTKVPKKASGSPSENYFSSRGDIVKYFTAKAVENVLNALNLEVLQLIFKHYSRISMYGRGAVPKDWFNDDCTISTSTFVVFARDFQIIPGHIHGDTALEIAKSVIRNSPNKADKKLKLQDFVKAVARAVAKAVLGTCLARQDAYDSSRESYVSLLEGSPQCIHSKESVKNEIEVLLQSLGLCDSHFARFTIDAIYGPEALNFL